MARMLRQLLCLGFPTDRRLRACEQCRIMIVERSRQDCGVRSTKPVLNTAKTSRPNLLKTICICSGFRGKQSKSSCSFAIIATLAKGSRTAKAISCRRSLNYVTYVLIAFHRPLCSLIGLQLLLQSDASLMLAAPGFYARL